MRKLKRQPHGTPALSPADERKTLLFFHLVYPEDIFTIFKTT